MADYLSNLVAKNLFPQENLHPRPLSRFESAPEMPAMLPFPEVAQTVRSKHITISTTDPDSPTPLQDEAPRQEQKAEASPPSTSRESSEGRSNHPHMTMPSTSSSNRNSELAEPNPHPSLSPVPEISPSVVQAYRGRLDPPPSAPPMRAVQAVSRGEPLSPPSESETASPPPRPRKAAPTVQLQAIAEFAREPKQERVGSPLSPHSLALNPPAYQIREFTIESMVADHSSPDINPEATVPPVTTTEKTRPYIPELVVAHPRPVPPESPDPPSEPELSLALRPHLPPLPELPVREATPEPAQTVHVSIGRIEVRANRPPEPLRRKPAPKPTVMSLDEYLQSRSNGGAR